MTPSNPEPTALAPADPAKESEADGIEEVPTSPPTPLARLLVSILLTIVAFFLIYSPWPLIAKLRAAGAACCAQIPSHTITFQGRAMPIDSRNSGIYLGVFLVLAILWLTGRQRAALYAPPGVRNLLMLCVLAMIVDGFNSVAESHHMHTYYQDTNTLRLITGTLAGMALTILVVPIFNRLVWRDPAPIAVAEDYVELSGFVIVAVLVILSLRAAPAALYYPLSILSVAGFLLTMVMVNSCVLLVSLRREHSVASNRDLFIPALVGLVLTCGEILLITSWRAFAHG
ncbi:MAG: DUF2085 domain-containing protein [Chloroflexota bacterium]